MDLIGIKSWNSWKKLDLWIQYSGDGIQSLKAITHKL